MIVAGMPKQMYVAAPAEGTDQKNASRPKLAVITPALIARVLEIRPTLP
jgi:hypothetical protein